MARLGQSSWFNQDHVVVTTYFRPNGLVEPTVEPDVYTIVARHGDGLPAVGWYVLLQENRTERVAFYTRATRSPDQALVINDQIAALAEWAASRRLRVHLVAREIATPWVDRLPKLAELLANEQITEIVVENPAVLGESQYQLLVAALAPQGRMVTIANNDKRSRSASPVDLRATITRMFQHLYGRDKGLALAQRALRLED